MGKIKRLKIQVKPYPFGFAKLTNEHNYDVALFHNGKVAYVDETGDICTCATQDALVTELSKKGRVNVCE